MLTKTDSAPNIDLTTVTIMEACVNEYRRKEYGEDSRSSVAYPSPDCNNVAIKMLYKETA